MAASHVSGSILSVDSSNEWVAKVADACAGKPITPRFVWVDIGAVGRWGYPIDESKMDIWPRYHTDVWNAPGAYGADLYFIDKRFRVACFAQTVLRCRPDAIIAMHDYAIRPHYHTVERIGRRVASAENLSFFAPLTDQRSEAVQLAEQFANCPR